MFLLGASKFGKDPVAAMFRDTIDELSNLRSDRGGEISGEPFMVVSNVEGTIGSKSQPRDDEIGLVGGKVGNSSKFYMFGFEAVIGRMLGWSQLLFRLYVSLLPMSSTHILAMSQVGLCMEKLHSRCIPLGKTSSSSTSSILLSFFFLLNPRHPSLKFYQFQVDCTPIWTFITKILIQT